MQVNHGRVSGKPSERRGATFTGEVHADPVIQAPEVTVGTVIFTPGARTYWHSHPGGQLLVVTAGRGLIANRSGEVSALGAGDYVWASPGEEHWHGAAHDSLMAHTAVSHGKTDWQGEVSEPDYSAANGR